MAIDYLKIARRVMPEQWAKPVCPVDPDQGETLESVLKGTAISLCCDLVKETLWLIADEEDAEQLMKQGEKRGAIYTADEIRVVVAIDDPAIVAEVHHFKQTFDTRLSREP